MSDQLPNAGSKHISKISSGRPRDGGHPPSGLTPVERAILSTIAYRDVFGFPVTVEETHRYLHGVPAAQATVLEALAELRRSGHVVTDGVYFSLQGREYLFAQRRERQANAERLWEQARRYARALATLPTVKLIGVTGSLACDNTTADADIDFMLVLEPGTLWRTRALIRVAEIVAGRLGGSLCVNYFLTERALGLNGRDLYIAQELAQMVPLYGRKTYEDLRAANSWVYAMLPNAKGPPSDRGYVRPFEPARLCAAPIIRSRIAGSIENWEADRKLRKYNETDFLRGEYTEFTRESTGHRLSVRQSALRDHKARLDNLENAGARQHNRNDGPACTPSPTGHIADQRHFPGT